MWTGVGSNKSNGATSGKVEMDENIFCTDGTAHLVDLNSRVLYLADAASFRMGLFNIFYCCGTRINHSMSEAGILAVATLQHDRQSSRMGNQ